jgi:NTE family protein
MGSPLPFYDDFFLGGFTRLSGSPNKRYHGDEVAFARLIPYWKVGEMGSLLGGDVYLGASLEAGAVWRIDEVRGLDDVLVAGSLFAGMDTLFGPIYVGYGYTEGGDSSFYFFLGRLFQADRPF